MLLTIVWFSIVVGCTIRSILFHDIMFTLFRKCPGLSGKRKHAPQHSNREILKE